MADNMYSSPAIAKEMMRVYGKKTKTIKVAMLHKDVIQSYVMKIEEAHKKAANSKLKFT